jgi:hypothetical protein
MSEIWSKMYIFPRVIVKLYNSFSTLSHNRQVLRKNGIETKMCALISSTSFVWNSFHYNKKWARYDQKCISVLVSLSSCTIVFPHYLIIGKFYEKMALNLKCVFWFCVQLLYETFVIIIRNEGVMIKNVYLSSCSLPVIVKLYNSFSTLSYNRQVFRKNETESRMCVLFSLQILSETFFIIIRNERHMIKNVCPSSCNCQVVQ